MPPALHAAGEGAVFKDTAFGSFNAEDQRLMLARVDTALKSAREGEPLDWKNDKTGASGTVTALDRLTWNGLDCRRVRIANRFRSMSGEGVYRFCEKPRGTWKLAGPDTGPG